MAEAVAAPDPNSEAAGPPRSKKKLIIIAAAAVVVLGGGAAWFMLKPAAKPEAKTAHEAGPKAPALYYAMDPPFVVNFDSTGNVRFLQLTVQLMTRDLHTVEELKANDPAIRNDLLLMYGNQSSESIANLEGKEKLRKSTLDVVRKVLKAEGGKPETVEAVYFTSFVMQ